MAEKKAKSKYQLKMRNRRALAQKVNGFYTGLKDGKKMPYAMPVLLEMKKAIDAGQVVEVDEDELAEEASDDLDGLEQIEQAQWDSEQTD